MGVKKDVNLYIFFYIFYWRIQFVSLHWRGFLSLWRSKSLFYIYLYTTIGDGLRNSVYQYLWEKVMVCTKSICKIKQNQVVWIFLLSSSFTSLAKVSVLISIIFLFYLVSWVNLKSVQHQSRILSFYIWISSLPTLFTLKRFMHFGHHYMFDLGTNRTQFTATL